MSSKFTRKKNKGGLKALVKRVKTPGTVDVGIIDAGKYLDGDITVAGIGFAHEFGTATLPERSFMRSTTKENKAKIISLQKKLLKQISNGTIEIDKALGLVGELVSDLIRRKIVNIKSPPNTPETISAKGSSNPLIDTSQMKNSITYEVND